MMSDSYEAAGQELKRRIVALIPDHPEILTMESPWDLFRVPGFVCDDLSPTMAMASVALGMAKRDYQQEPRP